MSFDTLFMVQHYILYRNSNAVNLSGKRDALERIDTDDEEEAASETSPLV